MIRGAIRGFLVGLTILGVFGLMTALLVVVASQPPFIGIPVIVLVMCTIVGALSL